MGYLNRFIHLGFPALAGVDEEYKKRLIADGMDPVKALHSASVCWVKIRNPRLIPSGDLIGAAANVQVNAEGNPVPGGVNAQDTLASFARLIVSGQVWDATSLEDEAPLLPMPPSADDMARMPIEILNRIGEELSKSSPR